MSGKKLFQRVPFTRNLKTKIDGARSLAVHQDISAALSGTDFPTGDIPYIMTRTNTLSLSNNVDTFVIYTSAHPDEKMKYTATDDVVKMNDTVDGGVW